VPGWVEEYERNDSANASFSQPAAFEFPLPGPSPSSQEIQFGQPSPIPRPQSFPTPASQSQTPASQSSVSQAARRAIEAAALAIGTEATSSPPPRQIQGTQSSSVNQAKTRVIPAGSFSRTGIEALVANTGTRTTVYP